MKLILPFLIAAGVLLGLYLVLTGRSKVEIPAGAPRTKVIVLVAASTVIGFIASCGPGKGAEEPGPRTVLPTMEAATPEEALENMEARIGLLTKLLSEGKLTEEAYDDALSKIRSDMQLLSQFRSTYEKELTEAEKDLVDVRRKLDESLITELEKQKVWSDLKAEYARLRGGYSPNPNRYDHAAAMKALGKLRKKGLVLDGTYLALSFLFEEVDAHHTRLNSNSNCYDMTWLGIQLQNWRDLVSERLISLENPHITDEEYLSALRLVSAAVNCFMNDNETACDEDAEADAWGRVSTVQVLDVLIALSR